MEDKTKAIKTVRNSNDDFSKLVHLAKKAGRDISEMEEKSGLDINQVISKLQSHSIDDIKYGDQNISIIDLFKFYVKKNSEIESYKKVYKNLLEESIEELLLKMNIGGESYDYNFFTFCIEN